MRPEVTLAYRNTLATSDFKLVSRLGLTWLESTRLASLPWLVHAWSTRLGGISLGGGASSDLNLGFVSSDDPARVEGNRHRFLKATGTETFSLAVLHQVHSADVFQVRLGPSVLEYFPAGSGKHEQKSAHQSDLSGGSPAQLSWSQDRRGPEQCSGDALLTDQAGVLLSVRTADCLPILVVDPRLRAVAAVHAGWRGAAAEIVRNSVNEMGRVFGSRARDILAAIGPSIRVCCYEVGKEVKDAFGRFAASDRYFRETARHAEGRSYSPVVATPPTEIGENDVGTSSSPALKLPSRGVAVHLDLVAVACDQLRAAGVPAPNIAVAGFCTACRTDLFFSHRREGQTGRAMAVIGIRKSPKHPGEGGELGSQIEANLPDTFANC